MGCKDLQVVLFLLLWLFFLGQNSEGRAQSSGGLAPSFWNTSGSWNVSRSPGSLEDASLTILTSQNGKFSFNLLLTNKSISSCAAAVQHSSNVTVWVANFNASNSGDEITMCSLNFTKGVGLVLYNGNNNQEIWSTNFSGKVLFDSLQLENSSCLYIREQRGENLSESLWKSFDYPTDTLVNGQHLTIGAPMSAALSNYEYSNGEIFYMRINRTSVTLSQDFKLNGTSWPVPYNSSSFSNVNLSYVRMNYGLQISDQMDKVLFNITNGGVSPGNTLWDYARLESNGGLLLKTFGSQVLNGTLYPLIGADVCSLPAGCGSFGICSAASVPPCRCPDGFLQSNLTTDFTCQRKEALNTTDCSRDKFVNITGQTYLNLSYVNVSAADEVGGAEECEKRCSGDCSCMNALHVPRNVTSASGACFLNLTWIPTIRQTATDGSQKLTDGPQTLFLRIPPDVVSPPGPSTKSSRRTAALAFAWAAGAVVLVILVTSVCWLFHSRRTLFDDADGGKIDATAGMPPPSELPPQFSYKELEESTGNFTQRLGYGGYSSVYAGRLPDNSKIAVKNLDDNKEKECLAAVATMGSLSHPNLVPLLGFCNEGKHRMLVYELVNEGRSLNYFLFRPDSGPLMDAQTRLSIAVETARGLAHLHENSGCVVIHGGVKPENIMIDREMHPRLVDYGLVNLMTRFQRLNSANARGSRAYMAPEWARSPPITEKVDVYSFGVVILELVSGRSCLILSGVPEEKRFLPTWGFSLLHRGPDHLLELVDPRLDVHGLLETDQQVLKGMTFVALWCVQEDPSLRPDMSHVVKMLEGDAAVATPPLSPALDALARDLCAGHADGERSDRLMLSPSVSENSEMRPSPFMESENPRHDHAWLLLEKQP